jgi:hypothetical protein
MHTPANVSPGIEQTIKTTALRHRVVVMIQDADKDTTPNAYTSKGARLLATFAPGTIAFGNAAGWNNLDIVNSRLGLSHSWSLSGRWILPPRLGRPGVLPRHDTICNWHAVRLLLLDPAGSIPDVSPSRLQELLYCTVATGGHGLPGSLPSIRPLPSAFGRKLGRITTPSWVRSSDLKVTITSGRSFVWRLLDPGGVGDGGTHCRL